MTEINPSASLTNVNGNGSAVIPVSNAPTFQKAIPTNASIEDLIPQDVKALLDARDKTEPATSKPKASAAPAPVIPSQQQARTYNQDVPDPDEDEDDDAPDDEGDDGNEPLDPDNIDTSPEAIEKLLSGDKQAVRRKTADTSTNNEKAPWEEDEDYQALLTKAERAGIEQTELNTLLTKVADSSKLSSSTHLQGLTQEINDLKATVNARDLENSRLKKVEKEALFDTSAEIQEKFTKPMNASAKAIHRILENEGATVPLATILNAQNRIEFNELIRNLPLDDNDTITITNAWKQYKDLDFQRQTARSESATQLAKHLSFEIPKEVVISTLKTSLLELVREPGFEHLQLAVNEGFDKHPDANKLIGDAKQNYMFLTEALSNPADHVKNPQYLSRLAKHVIDNADARLHRDKYYTERENHTKTLDSLKKIVVKYSELLDSASGISNKPGAALFANGNGSRSEPDRDKTLKDLKKIASGDVNLDELLRRD